MIKYSEELTVFFPLKRLLYRNIQKNSVIKCSIISFSCFLRQRSSTVYQQKPQKQHIIPPKNLKATQTSKPLQFLFKLLQILFTSLLNSHQPHTRCVNFLPHLKLIIIAWFIVVLFSWWIWIFHFVWFFFSFFSSFSLIHHRIKQLNSFALSLSLKLLYTKRSQRSGAKPCSVTLQILLKTERNQMTKNILLPLRNKIELFKQNRTPHDLI